jgi:hypothetical protein
VFDELNATPKAEPSAALLDSGGGQEWAPTGDTNGTPVRLIGSLAEEQPSLSDLLVFLPELASVSAPVCQSASSSDWFIHGPVPLQWVLRAAKSAGKSAAALTLGLTLWWKAGCQKSLTGLTFPVRLLGEWGYTKKRRGRAVRALEKGRLVKCRKDHRGRRVFDLLLTTEEMDTYTRRARRGPADG